jgi:hypothetical protein
LTSIFLFLSFLLLELELPQQPSNVSILFFFWREQERAEGLMAAARNCGEHGIDAGAERRRNSSGGMN